MSTRERGHCIIEDCGRPHHARGYCNMHWLRWKRHGSPLTVPPRVPHNKGTADHARRRLYHMWENMKRRCLCPDDPKYRLYGGRGIEVCERWVASFAAFAADMGPVPSEKHSLDRIDNEGGYYPENCRWASLQEQGRNKRNNVMLTHAGQTMPLCAWAEQLGISYYTLRNRVRRGLPAERVFNPALYRVPRAHSK